MKKYMKSVIPVIIIIIMVFTIKFIMDNPPSTQKKSSSGGPKVSVEIKKLLFTDFEPSIESYGLVDAAVKTELLSEVKGKIIYVSESFKDGGTFGQGDLLLSIEDEDYQADVKIANAALILAQQNLLEEEAKAKQAKEDWERVSVFEKPNSLVLRIPQLASANANVEAARAQLQKAKLLLKRTKIIAPFDGRVIQKNIDISQVVPSNMILGSLYALNNVQIRLPIKNSDIKLLDLHTNPRVNLHSTISSNIYKGMIKRSESRIDSDSGQLYVIAQIQPNKEIYVGEYLKAKIQGKRLKNIILIPNDSIYQGSFVYVEKEGVLMQRPIEILWQGDEYSIIKKGLNVGDNLIVTMLGAISSGTKVKVLKGDEQ